MTRQQIDDVATAARGAAIGQAVQYGNRCVFAIVVCGLDVGAPMAVQSNLVGGKNEDIMRILQNGVRALQNNPGGKTGGGLILLSAILLWLGAMAIAVAGCGSVEGTHDAITDGTAGAGGVSATGAAGGAGGTLPAGMAGAGAAGGDGAAGAAGGAAGGGGSAGAGDGGGTVGTAGAGGGAAGMTGAAGAGGSCAPRVAGAACHQCPPPAPTCPTSGRGRFLCCDQAGLPSCDPTWCAQ